MSGIVFPVKIDAKITAALQAAQKKIADIKAKIQDINKNKINPKISEGIAKLKENFSGLKDKLNDQVKSIPVVGEKLAELLTMLGPVGLAITAVGLAAFGAASHFFKLADEFNKTNKLFKDFESNGAKVDILTAKSKALAQTFEYTDEEISKATKSISKTFGIDSVQAMEKLQQASIAAGKKLPLEDITEFATQIKSIGGDADSLLSTMAISTKEGLFSNKSLDMLKEFGTRVRENGKGVQDLLKSTGNTKVGKDLEKGLITQEQAFKNIFGNLDKLSTSKAQETISTLLGGAGEDLGRQGIESIAKFKGGLDELIDKNNEVVQENKKRLELEEELASVQGKNAKGFIPILKAWNIFKLNAQILFEKILTPISGLFTDIWDSLKEIYNVMKITTGNFLGLKIVIGIIVANFKMAIGILRGAFQIVTSILKGFIKLKDFLVNIFLKVFDKIFGAGAFEKVKDFFIRVKDFVVDVFKGIGDFFVKLWETVNLGLQGDFKGAKEAWNKANSIIVPGSNSSKDENKKVNEDLNKSLTENSDNSVKGATSEVKNIVYNLEALQKIGTQNIHNNKDVGDLSTLLQRQLIQLGNDVNQTGNN
jgi:acyl carrier protein